MGSAVHLLYHSVAGALSRGAVLGVRQIGNDEGILDIVYVLGASSSMRNGNKIGKAKATLEKALGELRRSDTFNLIIFNKNATTFRDDPVPATPTNVTNARIFMDAIRISDGSDISAAMDLALSMTGITNIYLMTDTEPNRGITDFAELRRHIREKNTHRIRIITLSLHFSCSQPFNQFVWHILVLTRLE